MPHDFQVFSSAYEYYQVIDGETIYHMHYLYTTYRYDQELLRFFFHSVKILFNLDLYISSC